MKKRILICLVLIFAFINLTAFAESEDMTQDVTIPGINTVYKIVMPQGDLYISSSVPEHVFILIKEMNIKSVLNLQLPDEQLFDEEKVVTDYGMQYFSVPVDASAVNENMINAVNKIVLDKKNYPLFIHCGSANRVAMMMALYNITEEHMPVEKAIDEAKRYGLTKVKLIEIIRAYAKEKTVIKK